MMVWYGSLSLVLMVNPFFSSQYRLGLLINIDWFQPYKHIQYSVGAIYIAILNFPRALRYRRENMIPVGVIPSPHKPALHVNTFLEQLVHDLLKLWLKCKHVKVYR